MQNKTILLEEAKNKIENDSSIREDKDLIDIMKVAIEMYLFGPHNDYVDVELLQKQENLNYTN